MYTAVMSNVVVNAPVSELDAERKLILKLAVLKLHHFWTYEYDVLLRNNALTVWE